MQRRLLVAGLPAFAGEVTGNCGEATGPAPFKGSENAAANCKDEAGEGTRASNGNSWCSFSGQNDDPSEAGAGGRTQNWGHTAQPNGDPGVPDPSELKAPGQVLARHAIRKSQADRVLEHRNRPVRSGTAK